MTEDRIEVTHLMGKKLDKPIIMKWKSETKKNKMSQVAAMFGKKLGEEFEINDGIRNLKCKITDKGVFIHAGIYNEWWYNSEALAELLTGKAVIVDGDRQ